MSQIKTESKFLAFRMTTKDTRDKAKEILDAYLSNGWRVHTMVNEEEFNVSLLLLRDVEVGAPYR